MHSDASYNSFNIRDFYNVAVSAIFSIDVGLAWCGYVVSTRWIKNTNISVEPSTLGWLTALICYPPFQSFHGFYFTMPSETGFFSISSSWVVAILAVMSIASYAVYMSSTLVFGLRFSNLTHRGIITTGCYRFIRHPAYASKNFSWWCVMLPYVIWNAFAKESFSALTPIFALTLMSVIYYLRARTEEKHLMKDPVYLEYCEKVKYRFIPGII